MQTVWDWVKWIAELVPALIEWAPVATAVVWAGSILLVVYLMWG